MLIAIHKTGTQKWAELEGLKHAMQFFISCVKTNSYCVILSERFYYWDELARYNEKMQRAFISDISFHRSQLVNPEGNETYYASFIKKYYETPKIL
jgi:hypothetical protein